VKSHEPSDLTKEQGSYGECFQRFKLNRGRSIDSSQQEPLDFLRISISGFHGLMFQNLCIKTRKVQSPRKAESLVVGPTLGIMSRVDISGFREIENRDFGVRGAELHDIATHELTIRRNPKLAKERSSVDYFWDRMIAKMKAKFIPRDYQITLFRRMQNLRQKLMTMKEYIEEFYRLNIRASHRERNDEKVSRYMNGLRYKIQDDMSMMTIRTVEDAYQMALKVEEKMS
jgi:hypothetical protein